MNTKSMQKSTYGKKVTSQKKSYNNILPLVKSNVLGLDLTNATTGEVLEYLVKIIQNSQKNIYVVTPNPEILLLSRKNSDLKRVINNADLALTDGMQLYRAAHFLGKHLKQRIIGTNFVEKVCEKVEDWPITVGFLGAGPGVAEKAAECLRVKFPKLKVVFVGTEWSESEVVLGQKYLISSISYLANKNEEKKQKTVVMDVLFVAFGAPKQELWMAEHINKIPVRVMVGVGGALDQIVSPTLRPPAWIHSLGLGWFYRLIRQPRRIFRQVKLVEFILLVIKEKWDK